MDNQNNVQSVERAFTLLELLSRSTEEMPLNELTEQSNLHKSTAHRLLATLTSLGYVRNRDGQYSLTLRILDIGKRVLDSLDITRLAHQHLEKLRNETQETVHLLAYDSCEVVYIQKLENTEHSYQMASRVGMRRPAYCTASGKSILSTFSDRSLAEVWDSSDIKAYTPKTIVELPDFYNEMETIRKQAYAVDDEENELGIYCFACPIFDYTGQCRYAISISMPLVRLEPQREKKIIASLQESAEALSRDLGYSGSYA